MCFLADSCGNGSLSWIHLHGISCYGWDLGFKVLFTHFFGQFLTNLCFTFQTHHNIRSSNWLSIFVSLINNLYITDSTCFELLSFWVLLLITQGNYWVCAGSSCAQEDLSLRGFSRGCGAVFRVDQDWGFYDLGWGKLGFEVIQVLLHWLMMRPNVMYHNIIILWVLSLI